MRAAIIGGVAVLLSACASIAAAQGVYHQGYTTQGGTYVAPHYQSAPDHSYNNNYGVSPNVNPYTGQQGTLPPTFNDRPPTNYGAQPYGSQPYRR